MRDGSEPGSEKIREIGIQQVNELDTVDLKSILAYTLLSTQFVTRIVLSPSLFAGAMIEAKMREKNFRRLSTQKCLLTNCTMLKARALVVGLGH